MTWSPHLFTTCYKCSMIRDYLSYLMTKLIARTITNIKRLVRSKRINLFIVGLMLCWLTRANALYDIEHLINALVSLLLATLCDLCHKVCGFCLSAAYASL